MAASSAASRGSRRLCSLCAVARPRPAPAPPSLPPRRALSLANAEPPSSARDEPRGSLHHHHHHHHAAKSAGTTTSKDDKLEIKDPKIIFETAWRNIESEYGGRYRLRFPRTMIFLMGAPGSGKGTHSAFILKALGISNPPVVMSTILRSPNHSSSSSKSMSEGTLINDAFVLQSLLSHLLSLPDRSGVLIDGFPRTEIQVELLKLLHERLAEMRREFFHTELRTEFPRPVFRIAVLFVDEGCSVERQIARGTRAKEHNRTVRETGVGELVEERPTDFDVALIRKRYRIFRDHYGALLRLQEIFPFHLIDASGSAEDVREILLKEFAFQRSLLLSQETYDTLNLLPRAAELSKRARQDLVRRLDEYQSKHHETLETAVGIIREEVMPRVGRNVMAGQVLIRSENEMLKDPLLVDMILDVLSERGFHATFDSKVLEVPKRVDPKTFEIISERRWTFYLSVEFSRGSG